MEPLATVEELAARVGEPIVEPEDQKLAQAVLKSASALVMHTAYAAGADWMTEGSVIPEVAVTITIEAATRAYVNPSGFKMERGDAVSFDRYESHASGVSLTPVERRIIENAAGGGKARLYSVRVSNPERFRARSESFGRQNLQWVPVNEPWLTENGWFWDKPFPWGEADR